MTVAPAPRRIHISAGPGREHSRLARWAVGLAAGGAVAIATSCTTFGVAYAVGGSGATADNRVGIIVVQLLFGGLLASLAGFALAIAAKVEHEPWALLWLSLSVLPALLAFLVLGEAFWWE
jgi:hypothetical protein